MQPDDAAAAVAILAEFVATQVSEPMLLCRIALAASVAEKVSAAAAFHARPAEP